MKFSLPLNLAIIALALTLNACTTLANRRDLYSPPKEEGKYTDMLAHRTVNDTWNKSLRMQNHGPGSIQQPHP